MMFLLSFFKNSWILSFFLESMHVVHNNIHSRSYVFLMRREGYITRTLNSQLLFFLLTSSLRATILIRQKSRKNTLEPVECLIKATYNNPVLVAQKISVSSFPSAQVEGIRHWHKCKELQNRWPGCQLFCSLSFEKFTLSFGKLWSQISFWCIICCNSCLTGKAHGVLHKFMACMFVFFPYSFHMFLAHCCVYGFLSSLDWGSSFNPFFSVRCRSLTPAASKQSLWRHKAVSHFLPFWYLGKIAIALLRNHSILKGISNRFSCLG